MARMIPISGRIASTPTIDPPIVYDRTVPVKCAYREWAEGDEDIPTGAMCGEPAKWLRCEPIYDTPVCEKHRCRCRKPLNAETKP